jgi:SAP domain
VRTPKRLIAVSDHPFVQTGSSLLVSQDYLAAAGGDPSNRNPARPTDTVELGGAGLRGVEALLIRIWFSRPLVLDAARVSVNLEYMFQILTGFLSRILGKEQNSVPPLIADESEIESPAALLFLSKFKLGATVDGISRPDDWARVLRTKPAKVVRKLLATGFLELADLETSIQSGFNAKELKVLAKERGLSVSGTKKALAQRLISADADGMTKVLDNRQFFVCTAVGQVAVERFACANAQAQQDAEAASLAALHLRKLRDACFVVSRYESQQVFPRGLGMDWKNYGRGSEVRLLELIFDGCPVRFHNLPADKLTTLRAAAGMQVIWGVSDATPWLNNIQLEQEVWPPEVAARMYLFLAQHRQRVEEFRAAGFHRVLVMGNDADQCSECKKHAGKVYRLDKVPNVPFDRCTCPNGCLCMINADLSELR